MQAKTILSVIGVDQDDADLHSAIELCREAKAHLSVLVTALAAPPIGGYGEVTSTVWIEERERQTEGLRRKVAASKTILQADDISFDVTSLFTEYGWAENEIGDRARYVDLTLIGGGFLAHDDMRQGNFERSPVSVAGPDPSCAQGTCGLSSPENGPGCLGLSQRSKHGRAGSDGAADGR